ncbi:hypothetical protein [Streptomyces plumbiresistens]|uniref:4Fe4S-binding SPASM domain-containing protein n=1 Tax=Streptomyces plumbiresistens TaxID=511811 RepID=A0ABP7PYR9_9ACTN
MLYDVTLPGNAPPINLCPQIGCEATFQGAFTQKDLDGWDAALQQGEAAARAYLQASRAHEVKHKPTCPFRCLPPAVLALCSDKALLDQHDKVWAILDD